MLPHTKKWRSPDENVGALRFFVNIALKRFPDIEVKFLFHLSRATSLCRSSYDFSNRVQKLVDWVFLPPKIPLKSVSKMISKR